MLIIKRESYKQEGENTMCSMCSLKSMWSFKWRADYKADGTRTAN